MIGAITTGTSFRKLFNYLFKEDKQPKIIGGNYYGESTEQIINGFERVASQRPSTQKPVKHFVISFAPQDGKLDLKTKYIIAAKTVAQMGYKMNQWVAVSHERNDPDHYEAHNHDHLHIAINMITYTGQRIADSFDKRRMMKVLRELEVDHNLTEVKSSYERVRRRPKQGRYREFEAVYYKYLDKVKQFVINPVANLLPTPPGEPEIQRLETLILAASDDRPTMSEFLARMQREGYRVEEYQGKISKRTGKPRKRFKYHLKSTNKPIYKINGGSRAQLLKRVDYDPARDDLNIIKAAYEVPIIVPEFKPVTEAQMAKYRYGWLTKAKQEQLKQVQKNLAVEAIPKPPSVKEQKVNNNKGLEL
jgi:hypothetical protein